VREIDIWQGELKRIDYDGAQLKSFWLRETFGIEGDGVAYFEGSANVRPDGHMIDFEDVEAKDFITSDRMLHFIGEFFDCPPSIELATLRQRLFAAVVQNHLQDNYLRFRDWSTPRLSLRRDGDDLMLKIGEVGEGGYEGKLSVSIATVSPVSSLFHFAMNITRQGVPPHVQAASLSCINPQFERPEREYDMLTGFAANVLAGFECEMNGIWRCAGKVKWVY
jgi:hypothetical protein